MTEALSSKRLTAYRLQLTAILRKTCMKYVLAAFIKNIVFANIVLLLIFIAGGFALKSMVRENFPEFSLDMVTITVPFPGADPEEIEEGIWVGEHEIARYHTSLGEWNVRADAVEVEVEE